MPFIRWQTYVLSNMFVLWMASHTDFKAILHLLSSSFIRTLIFGPNMTSSLFAYFSLVLFSDNELFQFNIGKRLQKDVLL